MECPNCGGRNFVTEGDAVRCLNPNCWNVMTIKDVYNHRQRQREYPPMSTAEPALNAYCKGNRGGRDIS